MAEGDCKTEIFTSAVKYNQIIRNKNSGVSVMFSNLVLPFSFSFSTSRRKFILKFTCKLNPALPNVKYSHTSYFLYFLNFFLYSFFVC